jgi:thiol-disulfide isomerase/thioredoxin
MLRIFDRKHQPYRIGFLVLAGLAAILGSRAQHIAAQSPPVPFKLAPELVGDKWLNTPKPITLASRKGKVTMVEFWAFACANCQANLPTYERWQTKYAPQGFTIIGIHSPELSVERDEEKLKNFVAQRGIKYPILVDEKNLNWDRWNQQCWPEIYLIDKAGKVRLVWIGELNSMGSGGEQKIENKIEALLAE